MLLSNIYGTLFVKHSENLLFYVDLPQKLLVSGFHRKFRLYFKISFSKGRFLCPLPTLSTELSTGLSSFPHIFLSSGVDSPLQSNAS